MLVAAVARNGVIGAGDALPWSLPGDLRHFRALTMGQPVLMGRKTFDSIGRPLPGRHLVVLSGDPAFAPAGVAVARSIEDGLDAARAIGRRVGAGAVFVAGGGLVYAALIGRADRLAVTEVEAEPAGDTRFPPIDPVLWEETGRQAAPRGPKDSAAHAFVTYGRRPAA